jgi:hypothetical protein
VTKYVIDTNVWVFVDKDISEVDTVEELNCIDACKKWLNTFSQSEDVLAIDNQFQILREYRNNIKTGGLAQQLLNKLETKPRDRILGCEVTFDDGGYAILPEGYSFQDPADRKWIAIAIQFNPCLPIVNATDTDWYKEKQSLLEKEIVIQELCESLVLFLVERKKS